MHRNTETLTTLGSSGTKLLLPPWLLGFQHDERETQFLLCWLFHLTPPRAVHLVDPTGLASPRSKNQLTLSSFNSQLTVFFFKNHPKYSAHRSRVWHYSHPPVHFLSGVFIMTSVIVTSSPRKREHLHSMCAPTCALSWTVLSLTKLKDKITHEKNDNIRKILPQLYNRWSYYGMHACVLIILQMAASTKNMWSTTTFLV